MEFKPFPKIPRLKRDVVVTEKIDGTNAQVYIYETRVRHDELGDIPWHPSTDPFILDEWIDDLGRRLQMRAGSRKRWIHPEQDNMGFARWVSENCEELRGLGIGQHFGEWYGGKIQRGYGLQEKRFALFNTHRWREWKPDCCDVVPVLAQGTMGSFNLDQIVSDLAANGSVAVPGFMDPEGIVVFHAASGQNFKVTCDGDSFPKSAHMDYAKENH